MDPLRTVNALNGDVEAQKNETRRVCRPVVANFQHLDEEQDPDPN